MMLPRLGACLLGLVLLAGCAGPMALREARTYADRSVTRFCREKGDCGTPKQTKSQRLSGRWLIDYDVTGRLLTVAVDDNGLTRLDIWNKK